MECRMDRALYESSCYSRGAAVVLSTSPCGCLDPWRTYSFNRLLFPPDSSHRIGRCHSVERNTWFSDFLAIDEPQGVCVRRRKTESDSTWIFRSDKLTNHDRKDHPKDIAATLSGN